MNDHINQFRQAMYAAGLTPPDVIEEGKIHRFPGDGKGHGNTSGWCRLFPDGMGGVFGDYSSDLYSVWQAKRDQPYSSVEREAFKRQVSETKKQNEIAKKEKQDAAAIEATEIYNTTPLANDDHPYLNRKGIKAHGARLHDSKLVIPLRADGVIHSLQFIDAEGGKRFLSGGRVKGCYFRMGNIKPTEALCIAEGFATGATIHEATGYPVVVAFDAGNLLAVAQAMREKFPHIKIILCADDDQKTEENTGTNPGLTKATEAARAVNGMLAVPVFGADRPDKATDFNDMAKLCGMEAVQRAISDANKPDDTGVTDWPAPQSLTVKVEPEPYPIDALPDHIREAVKEVAGFVKSPLPLVASSALAAMSLASQAHADAKRADKLHGPVGLFLLTIADSGERKSTCDGFFTKAIRDYEEAQAEAAKPILKDYFAANEIWKSKHGGIKEKIKQLAKAGKPTHSEEVTLRDLEHSKPEPPRIPRLLYADATPEALAYGLAKQWPSGGVVSAEAGIVFGSHGMGKDSVMRNLGLLNQLWDGTSLTIDRRTSESFTVRGARLTVALQVQEPTLREFFTRSGALARGTGFLARFLVAWPESTQGQRLFTEGPENWPHLDAFHRRIAAILDQPVPIDEDGALTPLMLSMTPEAKTAWVEYHNTIEGELSSGGELYDVRDVASKSADNAARLAALFQMFEGAGGAIGLAAFESASQIAAWHLDEARRFFGELALPVELADAARLDSWLTEYCQTRKLQSVGKNHVRQHGPLRDGVRLDTAIRELADLDRVRLVRDGKRQTIEINPALVVTP